MRILIANMFVRQMRKCVDAILKAAFSFYDQCVLIAIFIVLIKITGVENEIAINVKNMFFLLIFYGLSIFNSKFQVIKKFFLIAII